MARRKRVFGSRKYGGLSRYGPVQLAVGVIDHYLQWDPNTSVNAWVGGIEKYQDNPQEVKQAQIALASWYMALNQVRSKISDAMQEAKRIRESITEEQVMQYSPVPSPASAQWSTAQTRRSPVTQKVIIEE